MKWTWCLKSPTDLKILSWRFHQVFKKQNYKLMKETSRKLKIVNWTIVAMTIVLTIILTFLIISSL